jgi:NADH-quinone oxidoreductase subunit M
VSWTAIKERDNEFFAWLLVLQTCMMGVFLSFDLILFYVFFELSLIPLFFLIGIWGGPQRQHAARKFFVYTLLGSLLTFLGIIGVVVTVYTGTQKEGVSGTLTFSIPELVRLVHQELATKEYWQTAQLPIFLLLMAGFAVKVPLVPLHTWLPLAHVEAPTAGSVDLAGVLLKIGVYGFLRLCIPLAPDVSLSLGLPLVTSLAAVGIVYGAFCSATQDDVKRLVAYSSVSHLGLCMLGLFSLTALGIQGCIMQMINHGLSTGALFLLIGMIYERYHTRKITDYGGMARKMPLFGFFLVFMCMSSAGLPGLNGFVGEVLCFFGVMQHETTGPHRVILTVVAVSGLILGAWYLLTMVQKVLFGPVKEPEHEGHPVGDLTPREVALIAPIAVLCIVIGLYPQPILKASAPDVETVVEIAERARKRAAEASAQKPALQERAAVNPEGRNEPAAPAGDGGVPR